MNENKTILKGINLKNLQIKSKDVSKKISKYLKIILIILCGISTLVMGYIIIKTITDVKNLNARAGELYNIKNYNITSLNSNAYINGDISNFKTIDDLIDYNLQIKKSEENFKQYLEDIQAPYDNFLKYIFLPSLNIWKDPFIGDIDYSIIGTKFLEKNPYNDIDLINKRSNFIKDVGNNNEYNEINSIEIGEIVEEGDNFYIPIKVSYTAPSYRGFLLLLEKLSITSNQKNLSLINEFIYNLRETIKQEKADDIILLQETQTGFSQDKLIGFNLYQRINDNENTPLVNDEIINHTIKKIALCEDNESDEYCYYKFRNKYRNLPKLSYTIGLGNDGNKTEALKTFLQNLPQIIKVENFTYDGQTTTDMVNQIQNQYKGTINFRIYGDGLSSEEVNEIQTLLGDKCIEKNLTPENALTQIRSKLTNMGNDIDIDVYTTYRLMELETLIGDIGSSFDSLSNYKKVIKTFEIYRMLNEGNVCN